MRITLVTFGTHGDCHPMIALGLGLQNAGHDVLLLSERSVANLSKKYGLPFEAMAGDIQATLQPGGVLHKLLTKGGNVADATKAFAAIAQDNTEHWMTQLIAAAKGGDAIVFSGLTAYVALSVAEYLNQPAIAAGLWPISPTREFASPLLPLRNMPDWVNRASHALVHYLLWRMFRPSLNQARARVCQQTPQKKMWPDRAVIYGFSPRLVPRPHDWPSEWQVCGAWTLPLPHKTDWQPPEALRTFLTAGDAPLYIGFGSMAGFDWQKMLTTLVEAVAGRRALFYPGWSGMDTSALPKNFHVLEDTPHDWLLPQTSAAIHHGGAGTTHAVAGAGIPSIIVPFGGDQFFWADRMAILGVAPRYVKGQKMTASQLANMIDFVERKEVKEKARSLGAEMARERGIENAVAYIEAMAYGHHNT